MLRTLTRTLLALLLISLLGACEDPPIERSIERFGELTLLLERNKEDPDALLDKLEAFVAENKEGFAQDRADIEAIEHEERRELEARYERQLRTQLDELLNAYIEVQDRLSAHPDKLIRFQKLMGELR